MSALIVIALAIAGLAGAIVRALLIDQVRGQIQRHVTESVEATIASLSAERQAEWGDEWRAELAAIIAMPVTAARFARGLRTRANELAGEPAMGAMHRSSRSVQQHIGATRRVVGIVERRSHILKRPTRRVLAVVNVVSVVVGLVGFVVPVFRVLFFGVLAVATVVHVVVVLALVVPPDAAAVRRIRHKARR
jgi:hypothetical protein